MRAQYVLITISSEVEQFVRFTEFREMILVPDQYACVINLSERAIVRYDLREAVKDDEGLDWYEGYLILTSPAE